MNISEQYRSSMEYREILRILQRSSATSGNILWQSSVLGKNIIPIHFFEIDFISREIVLKYDDETFGLDCDSPIYIKLSYRETVFKVSAFRKSPGSLHFIFPELVKTQEFRKSNRTTFKPNQDKFITLKSALNLGPKDLASELKVAVIDVSESGLGLVFSENNRNFLKNNRILWITTLQHQNLDTPVIAEVVYINSDVDSGFQNKRQKNLKVGLKISGSLPEDILSRFIQ
jgi:hypothetical protein